jgi:hypothetical protein
LCTLLIEVSAFLEHNYMDTPIRFETWQYISFVLAFSLFMYMGVQLIRWFVRELKPKKPSVAIRQ